MAHQGARVLRPRQAAAAHRRGAGDAGAQVHRGLRAAHRPDLHAPTSARSRSGSSGTCGEGLRRSSARARVRARGRRRSSSPASTGAAGSSRRSLAAGPRAFDPEPLSYPGGCAARVRRARRARPPAAAARALRPPRGVLLRAARGPARGGAAARARRARPRRDLPAPAARIRCSTRCAGSSARASSGCRCPPPIVRHFMAGPDAPDGARHGGPARDRGGLGARCSPTAPRRRCGWTPARRSPGSRCPILFLAPDARPAHPDRRARGRARGPPRRGGGARRRAAHDPAALPARVASPASRSSSRPAGRPAPARSRERQVPSAHPPPVPRVREPPMTARRGAAHSRRALLTWRHDAATPGMHATAGTRRRRAARPRAARRPHRRASRRSRPRSPAP